MGDVYNVLRIKRLYSYKPLDMHRKKEELVEYVGCMRITKPSYCNWVLLYQLDSQRH